MVSLHCKLKERASYLSWWLNVVCCGLR